MKMRIGQCLLVITAMLALNGCLPYSTGPTEVGVRTVKWWPFKKTGVQEKILPPGSTYFLVPFFNDFATFDTSLQNFEMTAVSDRGDRTGRDDLLLKTIDGNDISLDVIISYRIIPEMAPTILQKVAGTDTELKENIVRTIARSKPRDIFGELNTEEFYNAEERTAKSEEVAKILSSILAPYGVVVERVGTRDYRFNPEYQQAIEDKKVADQQAEKLKAETRATEEEYLMKVAKEQAEIAKIKATADGVYEVAVIEADAKLEQQKRIAEAIEAEGKAEAEGIEKMNEALAGAGGEAMLKMRIAEALLNKRIVMVPMGNGGLDVRSTNVNDLLQMYGIQKIAQPSSPAPRSPAGTPEKSPAAADTPAMNTDDMPRLKPIALPSMKPSPRKPVPQAASNSGNQ